MPSLNWIEPPYNAKQRHYNKRKEWLTLFSRWQHLGRKNLKFLRHCFLFFKFIDPNVEQETDKLKDSGISSLAQYNGMKQIFAVESGIHLKETGIPLTMGIRNPSSTNKGSGIQYPESGIDGVESRIQGCLGFRYMKAI